MRTVCVMTLIVAVAIAAGCKPLYYEGMPAKGEPHAIAVERDGVDFIEVDGRPVGRGAFASQKVRLTPGPHEILARYSENIHDTDYAGDLEIDIDVHYWSRFAHVIGFEAHEGLRYDIAAEADLPGTEISYDLYERDLPPDYPNSKTGEIRITIEHELKDPADWRPVIIRTLPIKGYWKNRPLPPAEIKTPKRPAAK